MNPTPKPFSRREVMKEQKLSIQRSFRDPQGLLMQEPVLQINLDKSETLEDNTIRFSATDLTMLQEYLEKTGD